MATIGQFGSEAILKAPVPTVITGVTTANPGVITATAHGLTTGQTAFVAGVAGATQANGTWAVTVLTANTVSIPVNVTGAYTSGGTITATNGSIQPGALCTVTEPGGGASTLYTNLSGSAGAANPFALDSGGNALFYSGAGPKVVTVGGQSQTVLCAAPTAAQELGHATTSVATNITAVLAGVTGLSQPVVVPASGLIYVETELPQILCTAGAVNGFTTSITGTIVTAFLYEDGAIIAGASVSLPVNGFAPLRVAVPRVTTPGAHTYTVSAVCSTSGTATSNVGSIVPFIRVTAA